LIHTFEGGCNGNGDYVADTPAQATPTAGCPTVLTDTCPSQLGTDPIENYMDYSDDICYTKFTLEQSSRMQALWNIYRSGETSVNPTIVLSNGVALKGQSLAAGTWQKYRLANIPFLATVSVELTEGVNGDADLFANLCSSITPGAADESCAATTLEDDSGLIEVYAASSFTGWTITARAQQAARKKIAKASTTLTGLSVATGGLLVYLLEDVPVGATLTVTSTGDNGDMDLYVYPGQIDAPCVSAFVGSDETCTVTVAGTSATNIYIAIFAYETFTDLTLAIEYGGGSGGGGGERCNIFLFILAIILKIVTLGLVKLCD
jgi:Pregnancy-associated plasma protein-A